MADLILKEETTDKLVFVTNPNNRKGFLFWKDNSETNIIFDLNLQKITRTKTIPKQPIEQTELSLDQIKSIALFSVDYSPMPEFQWPSVLALTLLDDSSFVFNSGQLHETQPLANKISSLIKKPVEEKIVSTPKDFPN
jgi:hypothetical protein